MSDGLDILREIGAQTIHNETHISREYVQAIIHETFDGLQSVQFIGFISILEREYNVDLSELKAKGKLHFEDEDEKLEKSKAVFISSNKKTSYAKIYIFLAILVVLSFVYMNTVTEKLTLIDDTKIQKVTKDFGALPLVDESTIVESNTETNTSLEAIVKEEVAIIPTVVQDEVKIEETVVEPAVEPEVEIVQTLKILPKRKIWGGYINIKTNQKYQKVFREEFALDVSKNWLLLFGAGTVKLEVNGENVKFSSKQNMRFKYVDGVFSKITVTEFKSLNKGRKW